MISARQLPYRSYLSNGVSGGRTKRVLAVMKAAICAVATSATCKETVESQTDISEKVMQQLHGSAQKPQAACSTACCMTTTQNQVMAIIR